MTGFGERESEHARAGDAEMRRRKCVGEGGDNGVKSLYHQYTYRHDNHHQFRLCVFEGERSITKHNNLLGKCVRAFCVGVCECECE